MAGAGEGGTASAPAQAPRKGGKLSLSNKEVRELASLPGDIEALEAEHAAALAEMSSPDFFRQDADTIKAFQTKVAEQETRLTGMMERWEALLAREAEVNASRGR